MGIVRSNPRSPHIAWILRVQKRLRQSGISGHQDPESPLESSSHQQEKANFRRDNQSGRGLKKEKIMHMILLDQFLLLAAGVAAGMGSLAGVIQMVGFVASGGMLLFAGLAAAGERSLGSMKVALICAGVAAAAFAISTYLFAAFGSNVAVNPVNPN
jgi:hypothetical protein